MKVLLKLACFSVLAALVGCTSYYEVKDPTTSKVYYTTDIDQSKDGTVQLVDEGTEVQVTIQNSEVREISKDEFKANAYKVNEPEPEPEPEPAPEPSAEEAAAE